MPLGYSLGFGLGVDDSTTDPDVLAWLVSLWPPGVRELYDLDNPASDVAAYFNALTDAFAELAIDPVENLRVELNPATCVAKLTDWERALGINPFRRASTSTTPARQAAIVSRLRESGSYSLPELRAILGPLLGYVGPTALVIVETDRDALEADHTYSNAAGVSISGGGSVAQTVTVADDGVVSVGGARIRLVNPTYSVASDVTLTLTGPDATVRTWTGTEITRGIDGGGLTLRSTKFNYGTVGGTWTLTAESDSNTFAFDSWDLFVEGAEFYAYTGVDGSTKNADGRGALAFEWAALVDGVLAGALAPADPDGARLAISRIKPAHTRGHLAFKATTGSTYAVADDPLSIADGCLAGS